MTQDAASGPTDADPGLQVERTHLAWRRTALSLALGSIVSLRILPDLLGGAQWFLPGMVGVLFAGWMWIVGAQRQKQVERAGTAGRLLPGARTLLAVTVFTAVIGALGLAALMVLAIHAS